MRRAMAAAMGKSRRGDELLRVYEIFDGDPYGVRRGKETTGRQFSQGCSRCIAMILPPPSASSSSWCTTTRTMAGRAIISIWLTGWPAGRSRRSARIWNMTGGLRDGPDSLDIIRKQIESTVKNRAAGETAKLRRKTSLIGEISRLAGRANSAIDGGTRCRAPSRAGRQPEELEDTHGTRRTGGRAAAHLRGTAMSAARRSRRFTPRRITGAGCCCGRQGLRRPVVLALAAL